MELTGKAKKDFKKWLWADIDLNNDTNIVLATIKYGFKDFPFSMQYGVFVDFFDSVGINIQIRGWKLNRLNYVICLENYDVIEQLRNNLTRPEARIEGIKKANEIYNNK